MGALAHTQDLRRHKRIRPEREALLLVSGEWQPCTILDISGGGASVAVDLDLIGDPHVLLCDTQLGMIAATVERFDPGRMVLAFGIGAEAKERLIDRLTGLLNGALD